MALPDEVMHELALWRRGVRAASSGIRLTCWMMMQVRRGAFTS
eukprot:CAMPEP_0202895988 /NCGR_PEP_ID=MMETSP1392-20130828/5087_1 /ASSEMBLY_ACC=CAM_ASM_000868 /TAXON_ID=225041 /ORGANISM="Chlamydomonas chlamydogama, Strain SAG 11-48b" /LENGTH=42 /DNA_ID= /DNA_START= /DNA_END= /DNA_ORIENTATION=